MFINNSSIFLNFVLLGLIFFYTFLISKNWRFFRFGYKENGFFIPILPFLGYTWLIPIVRITENVVGALSLMGKLFGYPFNLWYGNDYCFCIQDPAEIKAIFHNLNGQNKGIVYKDIAYIFRNSLLTIPYEKWRIRRKHYAKCFKPQSLKLFSDIYYKGSTELIEKIKNAKTTGYDFFVNYAFSNFFNTASGLEETPKGMYKVGKCLMAFQEDFAKKMLDPLTPTGLWIRYHPGGINTAKNIDQIRAINEQIMEDKSHQRSDFKDFVENSNTPQLLDMMMSIKGTHINNDDMCDDLVFFSAAAADTSGHTLMIGFTLLGIYPDIQERIYQEVMETVGHDKITSEDLPSLVYTEATLHEILRLFPVIPLVSRKLTKDVDVGTRIIPKGVNIVVSLYDLHRSEKYWPNPSKFDPSRFLPENASKIVPFSYLAFSTGPRDCLGKAQAITMLKISLASVVRNFKITSKHKSVEELKVMSSITLKTIDALDCHFEPRL